MIQNIQDFFKPTYTPDDVLKRRKGNRTFGKDSSLLPDFIYSECTYLNSYLKSGSSEKFLRATLIIEASVSKKVG